ncbi:MAG: NAD(P)-dependent oxidoreductase, partial [Spirochaetales bacterium]|nr:NAD(P)-dependent oxidoreductase [Candidatus Physcosoma equi]
LSTGNYCYSMDAVRGLLTILTKGHDGEAYNVSNPETFTTIGAMAQMVAEKIAGGAISVIYDLKDMGYAQDTRMKLNSDKLQALGWKPEVGLEEAYRRLLAYLGENQDM